MREMLQIILFVFAKSGPNSIFQETVFAEIRPHGNEQIMKNGI